LTTALRSFYTVGRVGTGYSTAELRQLQQKLLPYWKSVHETGFPAALGDLKVEKPHVWIDPSWCETRWCMPWTDAWNSSVILSVKCGEVVKSDRVRSAVLLSGLTIAVG